MSGSSHDKDYAGNNNGSFFMKFLLGFIMFIMLVYYVLGQNYNSVPLPK
jgi:hypothetical protein